MSSARSKGFDIEYNFNKSSRRLHKGLLAVRRSLNTSTMIGKEAFMPMGTMSLIIYRVMKDLVANHMDVLLSYWTYFVQLVRLA